MRMSPIGSRYLDILFPVNGDVLGGLRRCGPGEGSMSLGVGLEGFVLFCLVGLFCLFETASP